MTTWLTALFFFSSVSRTQRNTVRQIRKHVKGSPSLSHPLLISLIFWLHENVDLDSDYSDNMSIYHSTFFLIVQSGFNLNILTYKYFENADEGPVTCIRNDGKLARKYTGSRSKRVSGLTATDSCWSWWSQISIIKDV